MSDNPDPSQPPETRKASTSGQNAEIGQHIIDQGEWADCWICEDVFRRRTQTKRYCAKCQRAFCEGWHGSLARGYGTCIICLQQTS
jgi:hypothetical protein